MLWMFLCDLLISPEWSLVTAHTCAKVLLVAFMNSKHMTKDGCNRSMWMWNVCYRRMCSDIACGGEKGITYACAMWMILWQGGKGS